MHKFVGLVSVKCLLEVVGLIVVQGADTLSTSEYVIIQDETVPNV